MLNRSKKNRKQIPKEKLGCWGRIKLLTKWAFYSILTLFACGIISAIFGNDNTSTPATSVESVATTESVEPTNVISSEDQPLTVQLATAMTPTVTSSYTSEPVASPTETSTEENKEVVEPTASSTPASTMVSVSVNAVQPSTTNAPKPTSTNTAAPTAVPTASATPTPTPTSIPSSTATPTGTFTPVPTATSASTYTPVRPIANKVSNLRAVPGTNYAILGQASIGQQLTIVGQNSVGDWYQLSEGHWIASSLVTNAPVALPVVASPPTPVPPTPVPQGTDTNITNQLAPGGSSQVIIASVFYDGVVPRVESDEYAVIANIGGASINLAGWRLNAGDNGQDFYFPNFELAPGANIRVYTNENHPESGGFSFGSGKSNLEQQGRSGLPL